MLQHKMILRDSSLSEIKKIVNGCLNELYTHDRFLFERNGGKGVSEWCLVFRFAYYLQKKIDNYYVDCDFNSSWEIGGTNVIEKHGKPIMNQDGTITKRFVDIIIHKRDIDVNNDFICFEIKKWNNNVKKEREKDRNNLRQLTSSYGYLYGFHLIFGKNKRDTKWTIFKNGEIIEENKKRLFF